MVGGVLVQLIGQNSLTAWGSTIAIMIIITLYIVIIIIIYSLHTTHILYNIFCYLTVYVFKLICIKFVYVAYIYNSLINPMIEFIHNIRVYMLAVMVELGAAFTMKIWNFYNQKNKHHCHRHTKM